MAELEIRPTRAMRMKVTGVVLAASAVVAVLIWLLTGGGVGLFARKVDMKTYLPDATGLSVNASVRLNGIQVGAVKHINISGYLDRQRAVRVDLRVEKNYLSKIPVDSLTSIGSDTMVGEKFLDIAAGKNPATVHDGSELRSEPYDTAEDKADLIFALQDSLRKVDAMVAEVASPSTPVGHYVVGEQEYDQALRSIVTFESEMRSAVSLKTATGDAVFTTNLYQRIEKPLRQFDEALQALQRGEGDAGHFYASDEQYNSLVSQVRDLRKSISDARADLDKSRAGLLDDESYKKLRRLLASTDASLAALNRGEGTAGELLSSPQLYESLVGSLKELRELISDYGAHPEKYNRTKLF